MDKNYGEKLDVISTFAFVSFGTLLLGIILLAVGVGLILGGKLSLVPILLSLAGLLLLAYSIIQIGVCKVTLYENGIIARNTFRTISVDRDKIYAIYWQMEGASEYNAKAPRRNQACAEIIMKGGKTALKLSAGFYRDLEKKLGAYQEKYKISRTV